MLSNGATRGVLNRGPATFVLIWLGQLVSLVGSGLTGFALSVWVYQRTWSPTLLSLVSLCNVLPAIIISPLAGALVDRWDRRRIMLLSDVGAGLSILFLALLFFAGRLALWHICLALAAVSALKAFQWPAYVAAISVLVPKKYFGRSSGMLQAAEALGYVLSPMLGGLLLVAIKLQGIFIIDVATFIFSVAVLLCVRIPRPAATVEDKTLEGSLLRQATYGWTYITSRPGLFWLLMFFAATNLTLGFVMVLTTPLVLSFASAQALGAVLSVGGVGMLSGSLLMSAWGGPQRRVRGIFIFQFISGLCVILAGLRPSVQTVTIAAFFFFFTMPLVTGLSQAIWQSKVPARLQGRVFALRRMIGWSSIPLAYALAGPLAEYLFEPWLSAEGPLAATVGRVVGVGPGRGVGLLFVLMGAFTLLVVGGGYLHPRLRHLEDEMGDMIPDPIVVIPEVGG